MSNLSFTPAQRTEAVKPSDVLEMMRLARELEQKGHPVNYLVQGEPDFDTPQHIKDAAYQALLDGYTHYPPAEGYPELRLAIAETLAAAHDLVYQPDQEILVTNGASLGLYLAINAVVEPGDEVIITNPSFGAYSMLIESAGGTVVWVPTHNESGRSKLDIDELRRAVTPRSKAILYCNPDNPTGRVMSETSLRDIGDIAVEHGLIIISDEVYEKFVYSGAAYTPLAALDSNYREHCILVNSFSKTYAMTGWRLGYNAAPPNLMQAMKKMNSVAGRAAAAFVQQAGIAALRGPQDDVQRMNTEYAARRTLILDKLATIDGVRYTVPDGGFYVFVDVSAFGKDSRALANELLRRGGVVLTPGDYYGPGGAGHLRLSFASNRQAIDQGMDGLKQALAEIEVGSA